MRARLLEATMTACAEKDAGAVIIDDVLGAANVSRGTFYSYFDSLQEAIDIVAEQWVEEAMSIYKDMYPDLEDPLLKSAVGLQLLLVRSVIQPAWRATIIQAHEFLAKSALVRALRADLVNGMRKGTFRRVDVQGAVDLHLGLMVQSLNTLRERKGPLRPYIRTVSEGLLLAMGVSPGKAREAFIWASVDLRTRGPRYLSWWREIP